MTAQARIEGIPELRRKLAAMQANARGQLLEAAVLSGAALIVNEAKIRAAVRTGNLRRSIRAAIVESTATQVVAAAGTNVDYARFVEFGTANRPARPYLRPAFDQERNAAYQEIRAALREAIDNAT